MNYWESWFKEKQAASKMGVTPIFLSDVKGWEIASESVRRPDNSFFQVIGVNIAPAGQREVLSWDQPMLKEAGDGAIVLVYSQLRGVLLQAKAEPGNDSEGCILLAPTMQASMSNLNAAHGGKKPPRSELVTEDTEWITFCQDGGRYFSKKNNYALLEANIEPTQNERWFAIEELTEAIIKGCANEHLLQAYALLTAKNLV